MNRRVFFQKLLGAGFISISAWIFYKKITPSEKVFNQQAILQKYLDVLIPADETPSAVELGIDQQLFNLSSMTNLLQQGAIWLEQQAKLDFQQNFETLSPEQIEKIITTAEQSPFSSIAHTFFLHSRYQAMRLYYADPRSRVGLVWQQTPQPLGFLNYQQKLSS